VATVFDVFQEVPYTFLTIKRGGVHGDYIESERELNGIFKLKSGMKRSQNIETPESDATLHAHPEDFPVESYAELVGQGIRVNGQAYSIKGMSAGTNFDNGIIEHLTFVLQKANFVSKSYES